MCFEEVNISSYGAFMSYICKKKNPYFQLDSRKRLFLKLAAASALGLSISNVSIARGETKAPSLSPIKILPDPENVLA